MKTAYILLAILLLALGVSSCTRNHGGQGEGKDSAGVAKDVYTCPMHPSVVSDRPGACPICGMALVKKSLQKEASGKDLALLRGISISPTQRVVANVQTQIAQRRSMSRSIGAVGVVDFAEPLQATVTARFRGRIDKLHVKYTGEYVRKGAPLFELYSPDLITAQQDLIVALNELDRVKGRGGDAQAQQDLADAARSRLGIHFGMTEEQIADVEKTRRLKQQIVFHSPMQGTVLRKQVVEGQYIDEGSVLYQLADLSRVWVYLDVYEKDLRYIRRGQRVAVSTEAYPGETLEGRVTFIDPVMNGETRTARVRCEFANPDGKLKPNMYVQARLDTAPHDAIVVPASAVISDGTRNVVWIQTGPDIFEPREVITGSVTDTEAEILSGLAAGDTIVVHGGFLIDSESQLSMPGAASGHEGHGMKPAPGGAATEPDRGVMPGMRMEKKSGDSRQDPPDSVQTFRIHVEYSYAPDLIRVRKGVPVRLLFHRNEDSKCTEEVVFKDFGIRKILPAFQTTAVEFTPTKAGVFDFHCGMEMVHGKIEVK